MSLIKTAVFLASRFEEFSELREAIKRKISDYPVVQLTPIDLNDGNVTHRPPLTECLSYVRRSEFMILLLGDTYGSLAPKYERSFTHLEYKEAIKDSSNARVLVFCIGESYRNNRIHYSSDSRLAEWQREVEANHTLGFLSPEMPIDEMASKIHERLLAALYDMRFGALAVDAGDELTNELFESISDDAAIDDKEIQALEEREALSRGESLVADRDRFRDQISILAQPAAIAALEQREEAQKAIQIREFGAAVKHLKRAIDLKPLDIMSNYWIAQLYVAMGRKEQIAEAIEHAERAARVAEHDNANIRAAASYMIAARASEMLEKDEEGLFYAKQAVEIAPKFAKAHVELARQWLLRDKNNEALQAIKDAYSLYPRSLQEVFGDPSFRPIRKHIDVFLQDIKKKLREEVANILELEQRIRRIIGIDGNSVTPESASIAQLAEMARRSVRQQHEIVCNLLLSAKTASESLSSDPNNNLPITDVDFIFNSSDSIKIVEWKKLPGDVIKADDVIFIFKYDRSRQIAYTWREARPVKMLRRAGDSGLSLGLGNRGIRVLPEAPFIFNHVPVTAKIKEPSRAQQLMAKLEIVRPQLVTEQESREHLEHRIKQLENEGIGYILTRHDSLKMMLFVLSLIAVAVILAILSATNSGVKMLSVIAFGVAASIGYSGIKAVISRIRYRSSELLELRNELQLARTQEESTRTSMQDMEAELGRIQAECNEAQQQARDALAIFEERTLNRRTRLLPFSSLFGGRTNDLIRIKQTQLDDLLSRRSGDRRRVEFVEALPEWLAPFETGKDKVLLFRIIDSGPDKLALSRCQAYFRG